jgi:hypothetical protein
MPGGNTSAVAVLWQCCGSAVAVECRELVVTFDLPTCIMCICVGITPLSGIRTSRDIEGYTRCSWKISREKNE